MSLGGWVGVLSPITTRIRKHITGGGWNDSVVPEIFSCDSKSKTPNQCTGSNTIDACFAVSSSLFLSRHFPQRKQNLDLIVFNTYIYTYICMYVCMYVYSRLLVRCPSLLQSR